MKNTNSLENTVYCKAQLLKMFAVNVNLKIIQYFTRKWKKNLRFSVHSDPDYRSVACCECFCLLRPLLKRYADCFRCNNPLVSECVPNARDGNLASFFRCSLHHRCARIYASKTPFFSFYPSFCTAHILSFLWNCLCLFPVSLVLSKAFDFDLWIQFWNEFDSKRTKSN